MARSTLIARASLPAGTHVSEPVQVPAGPARVVRITLDPQPWNDPADTLSFGVERSDDGGQTWQHVVSGTTVGGSLDKFGNLPSVAITLDANETWLARGFLVLSRRMNIGIFGDVE